MIGKQIRQVIDLCPIRVVLILVRLGPAQDTWHLVVQSRFPELNGRQFLQTLMECFAFDRVFFDDEYRLAVAAWRGFCQKIDQLTLAPFGVLVTGRENKHKGSTAPNLFKQCRRDLGIGDQLVIHPDIRLPAERRLECSFQPVFQGSHPPVLTSGRTIVVEMRIADKNIVHGDQ